MTPAGPHVRAAGSGASWLQGVRGPPVLKGLGSVPGPAWPRRGRPQAAVPSGWRGMPSPRQLLIPWPVMWVCVAARTSGGVF